ncbi:hypothetical protein TNCV_3221541 [Trichonephila clavipes]|nr:hypothetical protein TNCV_3221541 [Trichonephila clavipes]
MKSLDCASPDDFDEALVAKIAVVAGDIREMPGYLLVFDRPSAVSWTHLTARFEITPGSANTDCTLLAITIATPRRRHATDVKFKQQEEGGCDLQMIRFSAHSEKAGAGNETYNVFK